MKSGLKCFVKLILGLLMIINGMIWITAEVQAAGISGNDAYTGTVSSGGTGGETDSYRASGNHIGTESGTDNSDSVVESNDMYNGDTGTIEDPLAVLGDLSDIESAVSEAITVQSSVSFKEILQELMTGSLSGAGQLLGRMIRETDCRRHL